MAEEQHVTLINTIKARDEMTEAMTFEILDMMTPILSGIMSFMRRSDEAMEWKDVKINENGVMIWGRWDESQPEAATEATRTFVCGLPFDVFEQNNATATRAFLEETHQKLQEDIRNKIEQYSDAGSDDGFVNLIDYDDDVIETVDELEQRITQLTEQIDNWEEPEYDDSPVIAPADLSKKRVLH